MSVCQSPLSTPTVLKQESQKLAAVVLILMAQNLPTSFVIFCLGPEIFEVKDGGQK